MDPLVAPESLCTTAARLRTGELDLAAYLNRLCDRIEALDETIQALLAEPGRRERLLREATELERRWPDPAARPPLFGIPVGIKDIIRVDGFPTRAGSRLPPELFAGPEASCVRRLRADGALVLGKTVTTEFAYFEPGPTRNPHNPAHTPGGSSSGSAAAVAAGYCPLALGSQTVGSVIRPAAFCGVAGFKPSYGLLPLDGVIPYAPSLDHLGLFTAEARDLVIAMRALLPRFTEPPAGRVALAVPDSPYLEQASPEALAAFEEQVARLQEGGWPVARVRVLEDIAEINARHQTIACAEMALTHAEWFSDYADRYRPRTAAQIRAGRDALEGDYSKALGGQVRLRHELESALARAGARAWICPAATGPAPAGLDSTGDPGMNLPWTHAGMPAVTVPAGCSASGLPLGLQFVGRAGEDACLVSLAAQASEAVRGA